jgi:hypothetical protein
MVFATVFTLLAGQLTGQEKGAPAVCTVAPGVLFARTAAGWKAIAQGEAAPAEAMLVSLFDATLRSAGGGVDARLLADVGNRGPFPILETAVTLHKDAEHDLALSPLRGLVVLTNVKKKGPATVRLGLHDETVEVTLKEPGAKLALEVYSRHAPGEPNLEDPKSDEPVFHLFFITLAGEAFLRCGEKGVTLTAPPGPAILVWDSLLKQPEVSRLEELPDYVTAVRDKDKKQLEEACAWARKLAAGNISKALKEGAASGNSLERKAAVTAMGALDELPALFGVLAGSTSADARDQAVLALRHWLGRAPGQTAKLDAGLIKAGYTAPQSRAVLHLLYGFTPEERRNPDTYDVLLDNLKHSRPAVRQLAHWHLVRLAPDGKTIAFDPLAPEAELQRAYEQWRALIPSGKLPPAPKTP